MAADDVLRAIANAAKNVSGVGTDAIARMLPVVDDWGWKGGKPGELTGGEYMKALDSIESEALRKTKKEFNIPEDVKDYNPYGGEKQRRFYETQRLKAVRPYAREADMQLSGLYPSGLEIDEATAVMMSFDNLEKAGIPREWTGRVYKALGEDTHPVDILDRAEDSAQDISANMRLLTNDQRETFLALLPDWSGSIDDLAEASRNL